MRPVSRQARRLHGEPGVTRVRVVHLDKVPAEMPDYAGMVRELREKYKITVRKWRERMTGIAYELTYGDGTIKRLISARRGHAARYRRRFFCMKWGIMRSGFGGMSRDAWRSIMCGSGRFGRWRQGGFR